MRKSLPKSGDIRIKSGFLFLPRTINHEERWLEFAMWIQEYVHYGYDSLWMDKEWVDKNKKTWRNENEK